MVAKVGWSIFTHCVMCKEVMGLTEDSAAGLRQWVGN